MRLARTAAPLPRSLAGRSRTCDLRHPKPVGWPTPLQPEDDPRVPPAGLEPAPSGLRARRHHHFDHGGVRLRREGSNLPLAINSRASYRLDHAGTKAEAQLVHASASGRRGSRTPKAAGPPVFETGYRSNGSPSESGPGRRRTCTVPGKNRELCRLELRSQRCGRQGSNLRRPAFQAGALPAELRPHDGRGWIRTSGLLFVRQALFASELLAREAPGQGLEPRSPRSERGVLPLGRSRIGVMSGGRRAALAAAQSRKATCRMASAPCSVFISTRCQPARWIVA
jgi:hypothetical protein